MKTSAEILEEIERSINTRRHQMFRLSLRGDGAEERIEFTARIAELELLKHFILGGEDGEDSNS